MVRYLRACKNPAYNAVVRETTRALQRKHFNRFTPKDLSSFREEIAFYGSALAFVSLEQHAMLLRVAKVPGTEAYRITVFNSGKGLEEHHIKEGFIKYQTARTVEVPSLEGLEGFETIPHIKTIQQLYAWQDRLNSTRIPSAAQTPQKSGNCALECYMAYMKHTLEPHTYHSFRQTFFSDMAQAVDQKTEDNEGLSSLLREKALKRTAKLALPEPER